MIVAWTRVRSGQAGRQARRQAGTRAHLEVITQPFAESAVIVEDSKVIVKAWGGLADPLQL